MFTISMSTTAGTIAHVTVMSGPATENEAIEIAESRLPVGVRMVRVLGVTYEA